MNHSMGLLKTAVVLLLTSTGLISSAAAQQEPTTGQPVAKVNADIRAKLGMGVNSFNHKEFGECVTGKIISDDDPGSSSVTYNLELMRSYEEFQRETTAEASFSTDVASFSAKVKSKYEESVKTSSSTQFLLVKERVLYNPSYYFRKVKLDYDEPLKKGDEQSQAEFFSRCGDEYVSEVQMGGEFLAMVTLAESEEELKSQLNIKAGANSVSTEAEAEFNQKMQRLRENTSVRVFSTRMGGSGATPADSLDAILAYAHNFPKLIDGRSFVPMSIVAKGYEKVGAKIDDNDDLRTSFSQVQNAVDAANDAVRQLTATQALINFHHLPDAPGDNLRATTASQLSQANLDQKRLTDTLRKCADYFWKAENCRFSTRDGLAPDNAQRGAYFQPQVARNIKVRPLDPKSPDTVTIRIDSPKTLTFRGKYCYRGDDPKNCEQMGKYYDGGRGWIDVTPPGRGSLKYIQYLSLQPGLLNIRLVDDPCCYGDNTGDITAIIY